MKIAITGEMVTKNAVYRQKWRFLLTVTIRHIWRNNLGKKWPESAELAKVSDGWRHQIQENLRLDWTEK